MLGDFEELFDAGGRETHRRFIGRHGTTPNDVRKAAQLLLNRQFLYRRDRGNQDVYDLIIAFKSYFDDLFDGMGFSFIHNETSHYVGYLPMEELGSTQRHGWRIDETILLLLLRIQYQEGVESAQVEENGHVFQLSEEVVAAYQTMTHRVAPQITRLKEIMREFKRIGLVTYERFEDNSAILEIRPAIVDVTGGAFKERLEAFNQQAEEADEETETLTTVSEEGAEDDV